MRKHGYNGDLLFIRTRMQVFREAGICLGNPGDSVQAFYSVSYRTNFGEPIECRGAKVQLVNRLKSTIRAISNIHRQGKKKNIILMATPRGGSTWVMEVIASQPGMKYYDEPFNSKRSDVIAAGRVLSREDLMPGTGNEKNICDYLLDLANNKIGGMNPPPFRKNHRLFTDRIVFKLHELEFMAEQLRQLLDAQILCLYRHPIPTSLSRNMLPRLDLFMGSNYYRERYLSKESWAYANHIYNEGDPLAKGVLSWCFENVDLLRSEYKNNWISLSYEELLLNSKKSCHYLADNLGLDDLDAMLKSVGEPSANITMSGKDTRNIMMDRNEEKRKKGLVTKWRSNVDANLEKSVMGILKCFEINIYVEGRFIPQRPYLLFDDTEDPGICLAKS